MTGDGGPHGDGGRLAVPDLTHGDDVRVLTQDGSQAAGEGHAGLFVDLALADAGDVIFHRVLERDDVHFLAREVAEHHAHRRGFAGARGADQQDHAAGIPKQRLIGLKVVALQPDGVAGEELRGLVEQAQHDLLAVHRRHRGDAQVDLAALHAQRGHPAGPCARQCPCRP